VSTIFGAFVAARCILAGADGPAFGDAAIGHIGSTISQSCTGSCWPAGSEPSGVLDHRQALPRCDQRRPSRGRAVGVDRFHPRLSYHPSHDRIVVVAWMTEPPWS